MIFFDSSKKNIAIMAFIVFVFAGSVWGSLLLDNKLSVSDHSLILLQNFKHKTFYTAHTLFSDYENPRNTNTATANAADIPDNILEETIVVNLNDEKALSIPVLVYHGVNDSDENITTNTFIEHMYALKSDGWQTVTISDFKEFIKGRKELPDKSFLLTFDDGIKDSYYPIDPILKDLGYTAVMFVITGDTILWDKDVPSKYYLSGLEIEYMHKSGRWDIESHGRDDHDVVQVDRYGNPGHFLSNKKWDFENSVLETDEEFTKRIEHDLASSRNDIEKLLKDRKVSAFAFPFGDFGQLSLNFKDAPDIVVDTTASMYDLAFYQVYLSKGDTFNYPAEDAFMIKRIRPDASWSGDDLIEALSFGRAKELPYTTSNFDNDWISTWGMVDGGEILSLKAPPNQSGASAFLNGSYLWEDYEFTATHKTFNRAAIVLMARYRDDQNYISCAFSNNRVYIKGFRDGVAITYNSEPYLWDNTGNSELDFSISVEDSNVSCEVDGDIVMSEYIPNIYQQGGIGIYVWNKEQGAAYADVYRVDVNVK